MERKWNIITSAQGAIAVEDVVLNDAWMGENSLTVTVENPEPIDFTIGDYIVYRGERYVIEYDPSIIKSSETQEFGKGFTYKDIKFRHEGQAKIVRCDFADIVLYDNEQHYTSLGTFPFHCEGVDDLLDRIQANLDTLYAGQFVIIGLNTERNTTRAESSAHTAGGTQYFYTSRMEATYAKYVDPNVEPNTDAYGKQDVFETVENIKCWDALLKVHDDFDLDFIVRDETFEYQGDTYSYTAIIVGTTGSLTSKNFTYGKGNGLYEIERIGDSEQEVVTRLKAYGNTTNLPTRYYSMLSKYGFAHIQVIGSITDTELAVITDLPYRTGMFSKKVKFTVDQEVQEEQSDGRGGTSYISHTVTYTRFYFIVTLTDGTTTVNARVGLTNYDDSASTANCIITVLSEENTAADYTAFANAMRLGNTLTFVTGAKTPLFPPAFLGTLSGATSLPEAMAVFNLMLPGFPSQSLYDWVQTNRPELITEGFGFSTDPMKPYIDAPNLSTYGEPRPASLIFDGRDTIDNIYPTIKEAEYGDTHIDEVASDVVIEDSGVYDTDTPPNFTIVLPDVGFDLEDYYKDGAAIEMTSGMCVGRKFEMASVPTQNEDGTWSCPCVREYDSTLHLWFPYASFSIASGDTYVFTGIDLPDTYIALASERLFDAAIEQLRELCEPQTTWQPRIDDIWMANNQEEADDDQTHTTVAQHDTLHSGDLFLFMDVDLGAYEGDSENPSPIAIAIEHLTINENANNGIATYEITLRNEKSESGLQRIQHQVNTIVSGNGGGVASSGANLSQLLGLISSEGKKYVLRAGDTLDGHFSFKGGVEVSTEGEGNALDVTGTTKTDDLIVEGDVVGNLNVDGDLSATGDASIGGDVTVGGDETIEGGLNIGTDETQLNQLGAWVDDEGNANFKSITAREFMATPVFRFNKITLIEGETWNTNAYGTLKNVVPNGTIGTAEIELEPKDIASIAEQDICRGIYNALDGLTQDAITKYETATGETLNDDFSNYDYEWQASSDTDKYSRQIDDSGFPLRPFFYTSYFTITHVDVNEIGYCRFTYALREGYPHPCDGMKFAQYGNFSNTARQSAQFTTISPHYYEVVLDGIDSYDYDSANIMVMTGWLEGTKVLVWQRINGQRTGETVLTTLHGVGFYSRRNIYFGEAITQIDPAEVDNLIDDIDNYQAYLTNPADTITVDDAGNIYNGLWVDEEDPDTGDTYRTYRLHTAVYVNKGSEPLVLVSSNPSDGEYTVSFVSSDCEFIVNNGSVSITKINNIPDGDIESEDDIDWDAMRNMREVKINIVVNAEGKFPIALTFPVTVLHTEVPFISLNLNNVSSHISWSVKNQQYIGLPIAIQVSMWRNNTQLQLTGLALDNATGLTYTTNLGTSSNKTGTVTIQSVPQNFSDIRELGVRATTSYAGSSYENTAIHTIRRTEDTNVYEIWATQNVINRRYTFTQSGGSLIRSVTLDINGGALGFYVSCDDDQGEHYHLTAAQMTAAGLSAFYTLVYNGVEGAWINAVWTEGGRSSLTIGDTLTQSHINNYLTISGTNYLPTRVIYYLVRAANTADEFIEDSQPVELSPVREEPAVIGLSNDSDSIVYDENGSQIGTLPTTTAYLKFGEQNVTSLATWRVSLTRCARDTSVALPSLQIASVTPETDASGNLLPIYADITATYDGEEYTARFSISYITNGKHKYWMELDEEVLVYDTTTTSVLPTSMTISLKKNPGDSYTAEANVYVKYGNSVIDDFSVSEGTYAIPAADLLGYVQDAIGGGSSSLIFSWDVNGDGTYYEEEKVSIVQNVHGTDGEYAEYIYRLSSKTPSEDNFAWSDTDSGVATDYHWQGQWTDSGGTVHYPTSDEFVPRGWTDDAVGVDDTEDHKYEWCSYRIKGSNGTWGSFRAPFTFAAYGENGKDGGGVEYIFRASTTCSWANTDTNHTTPLYPSSYTDPSTLPVDPDDEYVPDDWDDDPMSANETNVFVWVAQRRKTIGLDGVTASWGTFTNPTLWARWGDDVRLAPSITSIKFTKNSSNVFTPSSYSVQCGITKNGTTTLPTNNVVCDGVNYYVHYMLSTGSIYTSYGVSETISVPSSTSATYLEFALSTAEDGDNVTEANTINKFTIPIVKDGLDGTSPILVDLDNEMDSIPCDNNGKIVTATRITTTAKLFDGSESVNLSSLTVTASSINGVSASIDTTTTATQAVITWNFPVSSSRTFSSERYTSTISITYNSVTYTAIFTLNAVKGAAVYKLVPSASQIVKKKDNSYEPSSNLTCAVSKYVNGSESTPAASEYTLRMSVNGGNEVDYASVSPSTITSSLRYILRVGGIVADRETIPLVTDGTDGASTPYILIKGECYISSGNVPDPEITIFNGYTTTSILQADLKPDSSVDGNNRYRGFALILVNRSTLGIVETDGYKGEYYDTYGNAARQSALATAISNVSSDNFVIIATRDAMYWSDGIVSALVDCGASPFTTPTTSEQRRPYAFIGYNGLAEGYALQQLGTQSSATPASVIAYITNGLFVSAKDGESPVYYEIISNIGSATIASDASSVTVAPSLSFYKRVGEAAKTAYSCYATMFTRTGTALHYQSRMTSPSTSYNGFSTVVGTSVTAVVFRIYDSATTSTSADFLAELEIPILKNGDTGARGKTGRAYYYLGEWTLDSHPDYIQSTDSFVADDYKTPMVTVTQSDGSFTAYVYVGSNVDTTKAYIATPPSSVWDSGVSDVRYLMSDAVFTKFAKLGSAIFNKDWMYSQYGAGYLQVWSGSLSVTSYSSWSYVQSTQGGDLMIPVVSGQWTSIRVTGYTSSDTLQVYVRIDRSNSVGRNVMRILGRATTTITFDFYAEDTDYVRVCARGDGDSSATRFGYLTKVEVSSGQATEYQNMSPTFTNTDDVVLFSCPGTRYGITIGNTSFSNATLLGTVPVQVVSGKSYTITVDAWATGGYMSLCLCNAEDNSVQVSTETTLNNRGLSRVSGTITATATCYAMLCAYMSTSSAGYAFRAAIRANDPFIPKVAVDWVTGYAQFAGGNVCFRPDGTVKFRNAMVSGYMRSLPTILDSTNIGGVVTLQNAWLEYPTFGGASYTTFGGIAYGFPSSAVADALTPTPIIDLSKAGSSIVFKNAPDDTAIVHLPFISHHFGGDTTVSFEFFYTGESDIVDFNESPKRYSCYTEMMRARSYVGSTIEIYNVDSSDSGIHDVYIVGCYNPYADGTGSGVGTRVEFSVSDESAYKSISQLHRLTYGAMVRLVCKRYSSGDMFQPWLGGGVEIVYWEVEAGATGFTAEQFDEGFIQEIM